MPDRPLLILPSPGDPLPPPPRTGRGGSPHRLSVERQKERLSPQFKRLQKAFDDRRVRLQAEASGLVPEEVVVLETAGTVDDFIRAVERVPGLEWLTEIESEGIPPDDDFFATVERPKKDVRGCLFMIFSNQQALTQMMSLWKNWESGKTLPHGLGRWKYLFHQLHKIRRWGVKDRLLKTGVLDDWRKRVEAGQEIVPCEIEMWFSQNVNRRRKSRDRVAHLVENMGGQIDDEASIPEIRYHAFLADLPVAQVRPVWEAGEHDIDLIQCQHIQFFRASGQMFTSLTDDFYDQDQSVLSDGRPTGRPVIALFDALPLQAHRRLQGRLVVDDPDGFEFDAPAVQRQHGTAMASLIVHGDLAVDEPPLQRPLYVRPIFRPHEWVNTEVLPDGMLVVDLIHRAVRRMFEEDGNEGPIAPDVAIINLSIGIQDRPFDHAMSPLARLLDWLSWRYKVLFVVSAGNYRYVDLSTIDQEPQTLLRDIQEDVIRAVAADARNRRILSPAEALNALTVASTHEDASVELPPPGWIDPYHSDLPSPFNGQGMGYRRGIKPDVLAVGGRAVVSQSLTEEETREIYSGPRPPGLRVASPGANPGDRGAVRYSRGTSNATALVSRACGMLYDVLDELRMEPRGESIEGIPRAIWLKALVTHGAEWGAAGRLLARILKNDDNSQQFKEYVTRLLGYGAVDIDRVRECTARRVTALGGGKLAQDESHILRFPLPPSLAGKRGSRRLAITLAWFSPVNQQHQGRRRAALAFKPPKGPLHVDRQEAYAHATRRGTLQHEVFEGKRAATFVGGEELEIRVSCRADAGALEDEVPYALAVTLEVAREIGVDIYDEIRAALHAVHVRPDVTA